MEMSQDEVPGNIALLYQRLRMMGIDDPKAAVRYAMDRGWIKSRTRLIPKPPPNDQNSAVIARLLAR